MAYYDVSKSFDAGEIGLPEIETLLVEAHGADQAAIDARRSRVIKDGEIVRFQLIALNRLAKQASEDATATASAPPFPVPSSVLVEPELLGDVPEDDDDPTPLDRPDYVAAIKSKMGILAAVRQWGKPQDRFRQGNRVEGIHVRCPFDSHPDMHPSAWVNTQSNLWHCGKCQVGGDVIDFFAARRYSLDSHSYHATPQFYEIVEEIAAELHLDTQPIALPSASPDPDDDDDDDDDEEEPGDEGDGEPEPEPEMPSAPAQERVVDRVPPSSEASEPHTLSVDETTAGLDTEGLWSEPIDYLAQTGEPRYDWGDLHLPEQTFLAAYMRQAEQELNWVPQEYFLMSGFQALGMACGQKLQSMSFGLPLTGSILLALVGSSGLGKSTAANRLRDLFRRATGPAYDSSSGEGVKILPSAGSPEALINSVKTEIPDPVDPKLMIEVPTTAWMFENELATFISKSSRKGGSHMKQRVMDLHDFYKTTPHLGELVVEDYSLAGGSRKLHDSFFAAMFLTQNDAMRSIIQNEDLISGFFNRIVPVLGRPRERQSARQRAFDPNPDYIEYYEQVWRTCRSTQSMRLPFADASFALIDSHVFFHQARAMAESHSIFARLTVTTIRLAFLLAVNEHASTIYPRHLEASIDLVGRFLIPSFQMFFAAAKATDVGDLQAQIVAYVDSKFTRTGQWPSKHEVMNLAFVRRNDAFSYQAMEQLHYTRRLVEIHVKSGKRITDILVIPQGKWAFAASQHNKSYDKGDFYARS